MRLRTLLALVRSGQLGLLLSTSRALRPYYRLSFLAAAASSSVLKVLAEGPVPLDALAARLGAPPSMRDGLEAWLRLGVWLGELRGDRRPTACAAALIEEAGTLHHRSGARPA